MPLAEGKKAPSFSLQGSDGKEHSLESYAGKILILYFYPRDDTPGCTKEACGFKDQIKSLEKVNAVVVGVSRDGLDDHAAFIKKFKLPFVLLSDPSGKMMEKYAAWGEKILYGKKSVGVIRSTVIIGEDSQVLKHWKKVPNAEAHPEKVLQWLEAKK